MRKKNLILCAGILSMAMLGGCGSTTPEENNTAVTQEVEETTETEEATETQETAETGVDSNAEFSSLMTEIYGVSTDAASAEAVAEKFKNYTFANGAPSSSTIFQSMAEKWFQMMEEKEGKDIRPEFSERFQKVTSTAENMDENLQYDVAYLNVVSGITAAIEE